MISCPRWSGCVSVGKDTRTQERNVLDFRRGCNGFFRNGAFLQTRDTLPHSCHRVAQERRRLFFLCVERAPSRSTRALGRATLGPRVSVHTLVVGVVLEEPYKNAHKKERASHVDLFKPRAIPRARPRQSDTIHTSDNFSHNSMSRQTLTTGASRGPADQPKALSSAACDPRAARAPRGSAPARMTHLPTGRIRRPAPPWRSRR